MHPRRFGTDPEKDTLEKEKLQEEIQKLRLDITNLEFQISKAGRTYTLGSGLATLGLAAVLAVSSILFQNYQRDFQDAQAHREQYQTLLSLLDTASDGAKGPDRRVAGIWALDPYWHDRPWQSPQYENDLAHTLSVVLITDRTKDSTYDDGYAVRLAAALVIGDAIRPEDLDEEVRMRRLTKLLYGNRDTWETGTVVRQNWFLKNHKDIPDYDSKLWAVGEAIRWNWEHLERVHLAGAELPGISLSGANLRGAYLEQANLGKANLHGADLEGAVLDGVDLNEANLEYVNLSHASLKDVRNFSTAKLTGANIKDVGASAEFISFAKGQGAVEMESKAWLNWKANLFK